ncbi:Phage associated protein [Pseudomonas syringae pv. atrofaciens]|nr:Phage associated protein [Pseudomonas syringae pv. atrofaciens]RML63408.1 Phage associated protein [Pseudomonas syringae pv. pisi]RMM18216.1 Phage associated protein [Pseudomonas syringae pv. pisi]
MMLQNNRHNLELEKLQLECRKLVAETRKLLSEDRKLKREAFWYPFLVGAGLITAGSAILKLLAPS